MSKSALLQIEDRVKSHLEDYFKDASTPGFVIGVSGGADSMTLLYIFKQLEVDATVVHLNYRKRGEESDRDQELVEQMCAVWGYDCHSLRVDPEQAGGHNFQQWAREQRYRVFRELQREYRHDGIAVAHHRQDQLETILQKLFRGAGLEAWKGMKVWNGEIFRPLLDTGKDEIMEYVDEHEVPYRTDRSNLESDFARNLLRNEWLPELNRYFPGWEQNVLKLPAHARLFGKALEQIAGTIVRDGRRIARSGFLNMDSGLQKALLLHLIKELDPGVDISTHALDRLSELSSLQTGQVIEFNRRWSLVRDREWFQLDSDRAGSETPRRKIEKKKLEQGDVRIENMVYAIDSFSNPEYDHNLYLDTENIGFPLSVRRWREGDVFQPLGMAGHQKVSDHLTHRKVSAAFKDESLVLESADGELLAVLFPSPGNDGPPGTISEKARCGTGTRECLVIRRERE